MTVFIIPEDESGQPDIIFFAKKNNLRGKEVESVENRVIVQ